MIRVLFVCHGNICRSPMADGVFGKIVTDAGLADKIEVDSAGTSSYHNGEAAHRGTLDVLKAHGIQYNGRSRQLRQQDFQTFNYVLAMDSSNMSNMRRMLGDENSPAEIEMFMSYAKAAGTATFIDVPDPYYDGRFDDVYDMVEAGSHALLAHIREKHNL